MNSTQHGCFMNDDVDIEEGTIWQNPELPAALGKELSSGLADEVRSHKFATFTDLVLYEPESGTLRIAAMHSRDPFANQACRHTTTFSYHGGLPALALESRQSHVVNVERKAPPAELVPFLENISKLGVSRLCYTPLLAKGKKLGCIVSDISRLADESVALDVLSRSAAYLSLRVENAIIRSSAHSLSRRLALAHAQNAVTRQVGTCLVSGKTTRAAIEDAISVIRRKLHLEFAWLWTIQDSSLWVASDSTHSFRCYAGNSPYGTDPKGRQVKLSERQWSILRASEVSNESWIKDDRLSAPFLQSLNMEGIASSVLIKVTALGNTFGLLHVGSSNPDFVEQANKLDTMSSLVNQLSLVAVRDWFEWKEKLLKERAPVAQIPAVAPTKSEADTVPIVGGSLPMQHVLNQVAMVAKTEAPVLLLGETGTGKELLARAVHRASARHKSEFVAVNCAAIPSGLTESEFFGHEQGAFTGALTRRAGLFEQADGGTLFLDEIGDIPYELQGKLLRVLQDQQVQLVGGTKKIKVDVRIVAATHRNLPALMTNGEFRQDLFFRLSVFPICIPPLRERREDVPLLIRYFVDRYCRELGKPYLEVCQDDVEKLMQWNWPGNVRELTNFIERSVICSQGKKLEIGELRNYTQADGETDPLCMTTPVWEALERNTILNAIRTAKGRIAGPKGAAILLGLKRTTLHSKMHRLGIRREEIS